MAKEGSWDRISKRHQEGTMTKNHKIKVKVEIVESEQEPTESIMDPKNWTRKKGINVL